MTPRPVWLLTLLLCLWALAVRAEEKQGLRVVVRAFEVYNAPDLKPLAPGLQAMMASRLAGEGYAVETSTEPGAGDEDWAVRTTITQLGGVYSIDVALEPIGVSGTGTRTYETAESPQAMIPAIESVAARLKQALERVAVEPLPASRAEVTPPVPAPEPTSPPAPTPAIPTVPSPAQTPSAAPQVARQTIPRGPTFDLSQVVSNYRTGPVTDGESRSLAAADVDGDGRTEIIVLVHDTILAFHDSGGEIVRAWESPTPRGFTPLNLSVGDVDGNGLPEVFVAGLDDTLPVSQALEWFGSALAPKAERVRAFLRVVASSQTGPLLLGMVPGKLADLFDRKIRSFRWEDGVYREQGPFPAPSSAVALNLDLIALAPGGEPYAVVTTQEERLEVYSPDGNKVYVSEERVKGSRTRLVGEERVRDYMDEDIYYIQSKTRAWEAPDGTVYLFVPKNFAGLSRVFRRIATYSHGQMIAFTWDGLTLVTRAQGPKIPGFIPDLDLGPSPDRAGGHTLYAVLVQSQGTLVKKQSTQILAYDLPAPEASE